VARGLVVALKFGARITLATRAAQAIADRAPPDLLARRTVVPVPAAPARRRARGFDPADVIATALARRAGLELSRCLRRTDGPRQVGRSRRDRMATPPRVVVAADTAPASVLLVDDVLTTGATLEACARALHAAGVESVEAVTFALSTGPRAGRSVGVA
jgi:predicted amidophosphoribosyltransferase